MTLGNLPTLPPEERSTLAQWSEPLLAAVCDFGDHPGRLLADIGQSRYISDGLLADAHYVGQCGRVTME